ncbi:MAG TPA: PAS domain-containing protein, partial [Anaerolineaceae bacterium]|nr:PAS domain-containing protein [Anaerolineaceae bacterium]
MDDIRIHQRIEQTREHLAELRAELLKSNTELPETIGYAISRLEELTSELVEQAEQLDRQASAPPPADFETGQNLLDIEHARVTAIIETAAEGILITDPLGRIVMANQSADRILNRPIQVGDRIEDLATADYLTLDMETYPGKRFPFVRSILERETILGEALYLRLSPNELRRLKVSSRPLIDQLGRLIGVVGVLLDLTEQYAAETEHRLKLAEQEAQRLLTRQREIERAEIAREIHD